ncbi:MAG: DUF2461 family protein, partial [Planctomycetes bacterium]|nr:DUF2461 family protein [Planctomycetota bacterium]
VRAALTAVEPFSRSPASPGSGEALLCWVGRLWEAEDPQAVLQDFWRADPIPGAGLWLPAAVLHLHDARRFYPWNETLRRAYATLDEGAQFRESAEVSYHLYNEGVSRLRELHQLHPLEVPGVLAALAVANLPHPEPLQFGGFCADTFQFLKELEQDNCREWMEKQRDRYRFAVREPLVELCRVLAERYVRPVLCREHGWDLETAPQSGGCLTSVCKNDYGRSVPYHSVLWITFHRRGRTKREDVQFFVRLAPEGLSFGFRLGRQALEPGRLFRRHVQEHGDLLYGALSAGGAVDECRFGDADHPAEALSLSGPEDLRTWAAGKSLMAARFVPANDPLLTSEDLPGAIVLTWDRLLAAYVCAVDPDPLPRLARRAGMAGPDGRYTAADFHRATFLDDGWLARARSLLELKRQLVLQGVPGTGKTHVARCLARWLTGGREDTIRLVQFHPAYSYEEFVEGIKVRSVEVDGRHDVTYPVEDGLLCTFAAEAARNPAEPHVLLIDEINRGNLPRIFGELLYLLEYRDQAVGLPYSKRNFRLPPNLYVIGTMNAADRSVALVDQALRRRFSFLDMPPDAAVLTAWLKIHPPPAEGGFAEQVVALFQRLNARLRADLGATFQVGHSYFMVPALNETRLQVVWEHHIQPLLEEYFHGQPGRIAGYELAELLGGKQRGPGRRSRQAAGALG